MLVLICCLPPAPATPLNAQQAAPTSTPIPTAPAVAAPTYAVQRGDVQDIFEFSGRWEPRDQEQLAFQVGGSVRRVNVRRGDTVTAGDLLADLQIDDLENQLGLGAALAAIGAGERSSRARDSSVESVTDAEIALANARLSLQNAQNNLPWTSVSVGAAAVAVGAAGASTTPSAPTTTPSAIPKRPAQPRRSIRPISS